MTINKKCNGSNCVQALAYIQAQTHFPNNIKKENRNRMK